MSTTTTNYNLVKPELTDAADITAMNPNWDTIDNLLNTLVDEGWLTPVTTANENLNNYVTQGIYSFDSAYAPSNRPTDNSNGWLIVIPWNNTAGVGTVKQIWLRHGTLNSNDHCLYVRTRISSSNAWSSWAQIYTSKDITASLTELNYLSGLSSNVQTQLNTLSTAINGKQASITGAASTITGSNLTASRALISNASGKVGVSSVTATELGYLSGATSNVQNQVDALNTAINGKQATLTFDSSPTNGSTNPVTSGGVYTAVNGKAPTNHATNSTTYGAGSSTNYGHVKLSDSTTSTSSATDGVAATPAAVKAAYDLANGKQSALTFDNSPTQNSDNPVKSGGVYTALGAKADQSALDTFVRPNLLDNWYFVGGGSQQGGGQFPINQRGNTNYNAAGLTIDKWILSHDVSLAITADSVSVSGTQAYEHLLQQFESGMINGMMVTLSALVKGTSGKTVAVALYNSGGLIILGRTGRTLSGGWDLVSETVTVPIDFSGPAFAIYFNRSGGATTTQIKAAKLELGDTQTLAHQENGVWVLNEIPDYNEQMLRCNEGLGQFAQVEYGSYTGTGTYGSANANSLTLPFVPKFLLVKQEASSDYSIVAANGLTSVYSDYSTTYSNTMTWSDKTVTWYSTSAQRQLNTSATVYHYVAVG